MTPRRRHRGRRPNRPGCRWRQAVGATAAGGDHHLADPTGSDADVTSGEAGTASLVLPLVLWVAVLVAVAVVDLGAYLVAAARGQALADAAALAAVSADVDGGRGRLPLAEAARVVEAGAGRLESCDCRRGAERANTTVSVPVPGLVLPRLGAGRVVAEASAVLAPPDGLDPGPTRARARWSADWP